MTQRQPLGQPRLANGQSGAAKDRYEKQTFNRRPSQPSVKRPPESPWTGRLRQKSLIQVLRHVFQHARGPTTSFHRRRLEMLHQRRTYRGIDEPGTIRSQRTTDAFPSVESAESKILLSTRRHRCYGHWYMMTAAPYLSRAILERRDRSARS